MMVGLRLRILLAPALVVAVAWLPGCGGGDADGEGAGTPAPSTPGAVAAELPSGVGPEQSAALAVAALGVPAPVDPVDRGRQLDGYDSFDGVRDAFEPLVEPAGSSDPSEGGAASDSPADPAAAAAAITVPEVVPFPAPLPGTSPIAPPAPVAPPQNPSAAPAEPPAESNPDQPGGISPWRPSQAPVVTEPGAQSGRVALKADLAIGDNMVSARRGDAVPPDTQQFTVVDITAQGVTLRLAGALLPDGSDVLKLRVGDEVPLREKVSGRMLKIALIGIRAG